MSFGWWQLVVILIVYILVSVVIIRWLPNMVYKKLEHAADEYAIELLSDKELFVNTLKKMHELEHSALDTGSRREWNETHPPLQKRIARIDKAFPPGKDHG